MYLPMPIAKHFLFAISLAALTVTALPAHAGTQPRDTVQIVQVNEQRNFPATVPAGNYSGITHYHGNQYLVVSDKSKTDGFFIFDIDIDSISGQLIQVVNRGFCSSQLTNRDGEGITYIPASQTVLVSGEADGRILEYDTNGQLIHREAEVPEIYRKADRNLGFEALGYNADTHCVWTCNESTLDGDGPRSDSRNGVRNRLRFQSFDETLKPVAQYAYLMDAPLSTRTSALFAMGVPTITPLSDGSLLVLEREFYVAPAKLGSYVSCRLFQAWPDTPITSQDDLRGDGVRYMDKHLLTQWQTRLSLFNHSLANYEGMCLGPRLADGSQVLILVSDSQDQYYGVLKDWFKTLVVRLEKVKE